MPCTGKWTFPKSFESDKLFLCVNSDGLILGFLGILAVGWPSLIAFSISEDGTGTEDFGVDFGKMQTCRLFG